MTLSSCVDGHNLSLAKGSGIATYGRTLLRALESNGISTQILAGPRGRLSRHPLVNETALVDEVRALSTMSRLERHLLAARAPFGLNAYPIRVSGDVVWPTGPEGSGAAQNYWISPDVFRASSHAFRRFGQMSRLTFRRSADLEVPDVMHWTAAMPIRASNAMNIYTVHDVIPLKLPFSTLDNKNTYHRALSKILSVADHVVVVSESAKADLVDMFNVDESRITNTYQSVDVGFLDGDGASSSKFLSDTFGLEWGGYYLHYGTIEPKKNLSRVVESYLRSNVQAPLVLAGATGWLDKPETALLRALAQGGGASDRVRQYDYLPANILRELVRGARATIFPSLYEGFGLPVIESMALGTPVITSSAGSLPEIAGDAAMLVDPFDVDAMASGIAALDADDRHRDELKARGRIRAGLFAPERYAERVKAMYSKLGLTV